MMKLETVVNDLDVVPEDIRENYEKRGDGKYHLTAIAEGERVEDVSELKKALNRERENVSSVKKNMQSVTEELESLKKFKDSHKDIDVGRYQELLEAEQKRLEQEAEAKGEWDTLKNQLVDKHEETTAKLKSEYENQLAAMKSSLDKYMVDGKTAQAIANHRGNVQLLMPHVRNFVKMIEENGEYNVRVVDGEGKPRLKDDGEFMTPDDLVAEMRGQEIYAACFEGSSASGSGASSSSASGGKPSSKKPSDMSRAEKTAFIQEHGLAAWQKLVG